MAASAAGNAGEFLRFFEKSRLGLIQPIFQAVKWGKYNGTATEKNC